jgi:uncharacterized repeat protein (TIGR03803 family)
VLTISLARDYIRGGKHRGCCVGPGAVFSTTATGIEHARTFRSAGGKNSFADLINVGVPSAVRHSFCSQNACADGSNPSAGLIDVSGTLYGTTEYSGAHGDGTVFALTP